MKSVVAALPNVILLEQQIPQNLLQMFIYLFLCFDKGITE